MLKSTYRVVSAAESRTTLNDNECIGSAFEIPTDQIILAHRVDGKKKGPFLLVCGRSAICEPVFDRIIELPSLPWLSGTLVLSYIGRFNPADRSKHVSGTVAASLCDATLFLDAVTDDEDACVAYAYEAYWTILRKMAALGMISGRGVSFQ